MAWIKRRDDIKRGGRRWQLGWRDASGKRCFEYFETEGAAKDRLAELGFRKRRGEHYTKDATTFSEFIDIDSASGWFGRVATGTKLATQRGWRSYLSIHLLTYFKDRKLQEIARVDISDFALSKRRGGLSRMTVSSLVSLVHLIFKDAMERGILLHNPATRIKVPTVAEDHEVREGKGRNEEFLETEDQIIRFVDTAQKAFPPPKPWGALLTLAVYTGIREGELLGLLWGDLDLEGDNPRLNVNRAWDRSGVLQKPKTKSSVRSIPIFPEAKKALLEWRMASKTKDDKARVFRVASGSAHRPLDAIIARLREDEPTFPKPSLHALRHTFASVMACRGVPPKILQKWMGHTKIAMTMEIYAKVTADSEVRIIEERLSGFGGL